MRHKKNTQMHPNKHTYAGLWLVSVAAAVVMHSLVPVARSQSDIQTDFGQTNSHGLKESN